jgi:AraC-like DNA-binding protein
MARYPALPHFIRYAFHTAGRGRRTYPYLVDWRRLPTPLVEMSTGGGWTVDFGDGGRARVRPGEVLVIPADMPHRMRMSEGPPMTALWGLCTYLWQGALDVVALCDVPRILPRRAGKAVHPLLRQLCDVCESARGSSARAIVRLHSLGFEVLDVLLEYAKRPVLAPPDEAFARVMPAVRHAQEHFAEDLTRERLADLAHLSPSRFHDVFRRAMGVAPMEYVMALRLQRARELLIGTDLPVYEIAGRCGFNSSHYFSRAFRRHAGVPPGAYRASTSFA